MNKACECFSWHDFFHFTRSYLKTVLWCLVASCCSLVMASAANTPLAQLYLDFHSNIARVNPEMLMDDGIVKSNKVSVTIVDFILSYPMTLLFFDIKNFNPDGVRHSLMMFIWRPQVVMGIRAMEMSKKDKSFVFPDDLIYEICNFFDGAYLSLKRGIREQVLDAVRTVLSAFVNEDTKLVCMSEHIELLKNSFTYGDYFRIDRAFTLSYVNNFHH